MKNFILILFALLMLKGGIYCKEVSADTLKPKCDYYTDNITKLFTEKYEQDVTGIVCDSQDKKSFIQIKNGLAHGNSKLYYNGGVLFSEANFKNDKLEGIGKEYYESGALKSEDNYKNGKLEGISKVYNENGKLSATITYKNDKAVSGICANGKKWNNAELSNWENGLKVSCN